MDSVRVHDAESVFDIIYKECIQNLIEMYGSTNKNVDSSIISPEIHVKYYTMIHEVMYFSTERDADEQILYEKIKNIIVSFMRSIEQNMRNVKENELLNLFFLKWEHARIVLAQIKCIFLYISRFFVPRHMYPTFENIFTVHFFDIIFRELQQPLSNVLRANIAQYREKQECGDECVSKKVIELIYENEAMVNQQSLAFFSKFEMDVSQDMEQYYQKVKLRSLTISLDDFLSEIEKCVAKEADVCARFSIQKLSDSFRSRLITILLGDRLHGLVTRYSDTLFRSSTHSLQRLLVSASFVERGVSLVASQYKEVFLKEGQDQISQCRQKLSESTTDTSLTHSLIHQLIIDLSDLFFSDFEKINTEFGGNSHFLQVLYESIDSLTHSDIIDLYSFTHAIASTIDALVDVENEQPKEQKLKAIDRILFMYASLSEKDEFIREHGAFLSRRLLFGANECVRDLDTYIIQSISNITGIQSIRTLSDMLDDLNNPASLEFNQYLRQCPLSHPNVVYHAHVLSKGVWPLLPESVFESNADIGSINFPSEMMDIVNSYSVWNKHINRVIQWSTIRGFVSLDLSFDDSHSINMKVLPIQAIVLYSFNHSLTLSFSQIAHSTNIPHDFLSVVLESLCLADFKILHRVNDPEFTCPMTDSDVFSVINAQDILAYGQSIQLCGLSIRKVKSKNKNKNTKYFEAYKACIIKELKHAQSLTHSQLSELVVTKMKPFNFEIEDLKECIDNLIEKELIERCGDNKSSFKYCV